MHSKVAQSGPRPGLFGWKRADIDGYMRRWEFWWPWGEIHVHNILRADRERWPHDHPCGFISFIVCGGYREELHTPEGIINKWFRVGGVNIVGATTVHRLVAVLPNTWTITIGTRKIRSWGFHTDGGFSPGRDYLGLQ